MTEENKIETKQENKEKDSKKANNKENKTIDNAAKEKSEKKKKRSIVRGNNLRISTKWAADICKMIKRKEIEQAIEMVEEVINFKRAVPMNNREVGHKKGKGMMAGRYPIKACKEFLRLLKQLNANAIIDELAIEECVVNGKADIGNRQYRRMGHRFKSTNLILELKKPLKKGKKKRKQGGKKK